MDEGAAAPRRDDDLIVALRELGDDLSAARPGGSDPVAGARHEIAGAGAVGARSSARVGSSRTARRSGPAGPAGPARWPRRGRVRLPGSPRGSRPARPRPAWPSRVRSRRVAVATVVLAVACLLAVAAPGPRGAVADLLGIGGVRVVPRDELPGGGPEADRSAGTGPSDLSDQPGDGDELPDGFARDLGLGVRVSVDRALAIAPAPMDVGGVGPADVAFTGLPAGAVTLAWTADDDLPAIEAAAPSRWGLILTAFPGTTDEPTIFKAPGPLTTVTAVTVGGRSGYWIAERPHDVAVVDPSGRPGPAPVRLAGNTLLWTAGGVTYRLESGLDRAAAIALAETIPPPVG